MVLALALWQTVSDTFANKAASGGNVVSENTIAVHEQDWIDKLAQRAAVLSLHREKLYDATAYYRCQPVCEYYIFTLRRILI